MKINKCPDKESDEWKFLVNYFTETGAWKQFHAYNGVLPDLNTLKKLVDIQESNQERLIEDSLKQADKSKLKESVDQFFEVIKSQNFKMKFFKNKEILDILKDEVKGSKVKEILERLRDISSKDIDEHFERVVKGFATSLSQISDITKIMDTNIRNKDLKVLTPKEQLSYLSTNQTFLNDYKEMLGIFRDRFSDLSIFSQEISKISSQIDSIESHLNNLRLDPLVEELFETMSESAKVKDQYYSERIEKVKAQLENAKKDSNTSAIEHYKAKLEGLEQDWKDNKIDKTSLLEYLKGDRGDSSVLGFLFKSMESSGDVILSGYKSRINDLQNNVTEYISKIDREYQKKVSPLLDKLGASRFNIFDFNKQFVIAIKARNRDGEEFNYLELMDKFNGDWQYDLKELEDAINKAKEDNDPKALKEAKLALAKFNQDYMNQPYTKVYYERFNLWNDDIGEESFKRRQLALDNIAEAQRKFNKILELGTFPDTSDYIELQETIREYSRLSSLYNKDGTLKADEDLDVAKRLQEYNKQTRDLFEYKLIPGAFYRSRELYKEAILSSGIIEDSPEYEKLIENWTTNNTRYVIKQNFYEEREVILNRINYVMSKVQDKADKEVLKSYEEYQRLILDQIVGYRDEDGQPNGSEISEEKAKEIKKAQEAIENLKAKIEGISGLTSEESEELSTIYSLMKEKNKKITAEQLERKRELENKQKTLGLSDSDKKILFDAIEALKELQSRVATEYYVDALNQVSQKLGMEFDIVTADQLLKSKELDTLLKDKEFKEWWNKNHIEVEKWDSNIKMKVPTYERIAIWNRIIPNDNKFLESTTLENGEVLYRQPAKQYFYRDVKEKYKTKEIVGETVDNRGNWLPKSYNKKNDLEAKDDKYINKDYYQLLEDAKTNEQSKEKLEYLNTMKEALLSFQEHLPYKDRLYLQIPSIWKSIEERVRRGDATGIKSNIKEKFTIKDRVHRDTEARNVSEKTDIFGNPMYDIPVKFTGKLSEENVSLDIFSSIMQYGLSTETKRQLQEEQPVLEALKATLSKYGNKKVESKSWYQKNIGKKINSVVDAIPLINKVKMPESAWRLRGITSLEEEYFKGIYNRGFLYFDEESSFSLWVREFIFNPLSKWSAFKSLGFDYTGSIVNSAMGNIQSHFDGIGARSYSNTNLVKAEGLFISEVIPDLIKDAKEDLGELSFYGQLFIKYNIGGKAKDKTGRKYSSTKELTTVKNIFKFFENPREFGELQIAATQALAIFDTVEVEDEKGNKKSLLEAYKQGYANNNGSSLEIEEGFKFSKSQEQFLRAKIFQANHDTQGNYNPQSKSQLERSIAGKAFFFMRKYLIAQGEDAFGGNKHSFAFGMKKGWNRHLLDLIYVGLQSLRDQNNYAKGIHPKDIRQAYKALGIYTSLLIFYLIISGLDPDDDRDSPRTTQKWDWSRIELLLHSLRLKDELEQNTLFGYKEIYNNFTSPSVLDSHIGKTFKLLYDFGLWITGDEHAKYTTGVRNSTYMKDLYGTDIKWIVDVRDLTQGGPNTLKGIMPWTERSKKEAAYKLFKKSEQQRMK